MSEHEYPAAAELLGVSEDWLRFNTPRVPLPHYKKSLSKRGRGKVTFSDDHIAEIRAMFEHRPAAAKPVRPVTRRRSA